MLPISSLASRIRWPGGDADGEQGRCGETDTRGRRGDDPRGGGRGDEGQVRDRGEAGDRGRHPGVVPVARSGRAEEGGVGGSRRVDPAAGAEGAQEEEQGGPGGGGAVTPTYRRGTRGSRNRAGPPIP